MGLEEDIANVSCDCCLTDVPDHIFQQARLDVEELRILLDQCKRPKVQSVLSVELRRLETQLVNLVEQQKSKSETEAAKPKPAATASTSKVYDVPYKNYCTFERFSAVGLFLLIFLFNF